MKLPSHLSCLLLLGLGASIPSNSLQAPMGGEFQAPPDERGFWEGGRVKWRRSPVDPNSLFSIAKELQSFGKEKAGIQFRFGRQETVENAGDVVLDLPEEDGQKKAKSLESLAEELDGYHDGKKTVWFGRRKRGASCPKGSFSGAPKRIGSI